MVHYDRFDVVFQEIPNEVSLAFTLKGCPNLCKGCHSPHLREKSGLKLNRDNLTNILKEYKNQITTVLFLGGDSYHSELKELFTLCRSLNLKVALYSGNNIINNEFLDYLDYYKIGSYNEKLGGLKYNTTNQKLYKINSGKMVDITNSFWN